MSTVENQGERETNPDLRSLHKLRYELIEQATKVAALRDKMVAQYAIEWADSDLREIHRKLHAIEAAIADSIEAP